MTSSKATTSTATKAARKSSLKAPATVTSLAAAKGKRQAAKQAHPASAAKPAAQKAAKRPAVAKPASQPLAFEQYRDDTSQWRARGAKHEYRVTRAGEREFYAEQRTSGWTPIAGKCATRQQAEELANLYEGGARQLSHQAYRGLPYKEAVAKLAQ